jgi:amino acid adenylation domain-containing protein/thioester reductase-like protein
MSLEDVMAGKSGLEDAWPLSPLQEGLLFHALFDEHTLDVYTTQLVIDFEGPLDAPRLRIAAQALLDRHSCLRTAFVLVDDPPVQVMARGLQVPWAEVDLSDRPIGDRFRQCDRLVADDRVTRFDLQAPPLLRFLLVKIGEAHHRLVLSVHHVLLDGWSIPVVLRELFTLYASGGDGSALPEVRPFHDYLVWLSTRDRMTALAAWSQALAGIEEPTLLAAADRSRPPVLPEQVDAGISADLTSRLTSFARTQGLTLNTLVQVAWAVVLSRLTGRLSVVFGMVVAGRSPELPGFESMLGLFINTVPVRVQLDPAESLVDLLHRVQDEQFQLLDHQYVGLADVQREVGVDTLFDTLTVFQSFPFDVAEVTRPLDDAGITFTLLDIRGATHYPISLVAVPGARLQIELKYRPDFFDVSAVQALADRVVRVLELMVTDPGVRVSGVDVLSGRERDRLLVEWNDTAAEVENTTLLELFTAQVARTPHAVAVVCGPESVTYAELDERAGRLADHLIRRGAGPERVVAVCLDRSVDLVVALVGVLRTGAAFVALELEWPAARIEQVCRSAGAVALVTATEPQVGSAGVTMVNIDDLPESHGFELCSGAGASVPVDPECLAYLVFTSGSTGTPKGVMIRNRAIAARLTWQRELLGFGSGDAALFKAPLGFDISINEIFLPLVSGARLVVAEPDGERDIEYLLKVIERERVTFVYLVSSMLDMLLELPDVASRARILKHVWCGGEALGPRLFDRFRATLDAVMYHGYGPAETTIGVTHQFYRADQDRDGVTIGRPNPNTRVYLLDEGLRPVPAGVAGELYVGGLLLGRGYVNDPVQTASRFVADPFCPGERLYRTGDLARWRANGVLEFCGRADNQVKIRGMRVELEEIEAVLKQHPQIRQAVVTIDTGPCGTARLIGYCLTTHENLDHADLHTWIAARLPEHMVPTTFITLETVPLTPNGKIDRKALPAPSRNGGSPYAGFAPPRGVEEATIAKVWAEILGLDRVGRDDNFFDLGGNSLLGARMVVRLREVFQLEISLRELFRRPTVRGLAAALAPPGCASPETAGSTWSAPGSGGRRPQEPQPWPDPLPPRTRRCGENVLLTGASGFFGAFLLREILAQYPGTVHCLVRADSTARAWEKLVANLGSYALSEEILAQERIRVIVGDLARPHLALGDDEYERLADEIDLIIHNGAHVDALHSYETVEAANVNGTRELLRLAATTWRKPLRFVSTVSAARYRPSASGDGSGYVESKWRAEQVVAEARAHGIPAAVYRVPRLSGDSQTGRSNDRDIMLRMIRWILDLGTAPDIEVYEDWIPVDEAARLLVAPSPGPEHGGLFVLTAQRRMCLTEIIEMARRIGHEIESKSTQEWLRDLASRSVEEHEVLASALRVASAEDKLGVNVRAPQGDTSRDGFMPIAARGVTEEILHHYLRDMSQVHRIG